MIRVVLALLAAAVTILGADFRQGVQILSVVIQPEATLEIQGDTTAWVKIRLREGGQAVFALQDACAGAPEEGIRIERSGTYSLPLEKPGKLACLYTTERTLSQPIPQR